MYRLFSPSVAFLVASAALATSPPDQAARDSAKLDHLQKVFVSTPQFGEQFWRESKRVADQVGPRIIHILMRRAEKWRGEEGLVFVPLVALLSRQPALKLLLEYDRQQAHGGWANEFLFELDDPDVKDMVRKLSHP